MIFRRPCFIRPAFMTTMATLQVSQNMCQIMPSFPRGFCHSAPSVFCGSFTQQLGCVVLFKVVLHNEAVQAAARIAFRVAKEVFLPRPPQACIQSWSEAQAVLLHVERATGLPIAPLHSLRAEVPRSYRKRRFFERQESQNVSSRHFWLSWNWSGEHRSSPRKRSFQSAATALHQRIRHHKYRPWRCRMGHGCRYLASVCQYRGVSQPQQGDGSTGSRGTLLALCGTVFHLR